MLAVSYCGLIHKIVSSPSQLLTDVSVVGSDTNSPNCVFRAWDIGEGSSANSKVVSSIFFKNFINKHFRSFLFFVLVRLHAGVFVASFF
jgi:hypothetical protein